jgi:ABC-2 type transport system permease protein
MLRNQFRVFFSASPIRFLTILLCSLLIGGGIFAFSYEGFDYLWHEDIPFSGSIIGTLFDFLFLSLAVMLIFSSGVILYSSLFTAAETQFLLSTPANDDQVFAYKFQGAIAFSSWAFLLLGAPVLVAYGVVYGVPWHFYALLPLYFLGYTLLPGSIGALVCLLVVNTVPQQRKQVLILAAVVVVVTAIVWMARIGLTLHDDLWNRDLVQVMVGHVSFAQGPLFPSHWLARGLQASARGNLLEASYYLALVWSNGLFLYVVTAWTAARLYRRGFNRMATGGELRRRFGGRWLDATLSGLVGFLDPQTRLLIVKDFRTFRRDPAQWGQIVIFSGLLTLYFAGTRRFYQEDLGRPYQNGISLLNLVSTALLMCAYTSRFIFPLLSLEGRKFWVLGLLPLRREKLLWGKFAFSAVGTLLIAEFLMIFSDVATGMPAVVMGLHGLTVAVLAAGLSGLSVGLGACMPNFREGDPSKIAVGFGGTLNLIVSLLFLLLVIGTMSAPWHIQVLMLGQKSLVEVTLDGWMMLGVGVGLLIGVAAVVLPLRIGRRTLEQMEF